MTREPVLPAPRADRSTTGRMRIQEAVLLVVPGEPKAKQRPRFGRGRVFRTDRRDEEAIAWVLKSWFRTPLEGEVAAIMRFYRGDRRRFDLDNAIKLVLDAGNGIAYKDDMQVVRIDARLFFDSPEPRTEIAIAQLIWSAEEVPC